MVLRTKSKDKKAYEIVEKNLYETQNLTRNLVIKFGAKLIFYIQERKIPKMR